MLISWRSLYGFSSHRIACLQLPILIWNVSNSRFFLLKATLEMEGTRRAAPHTTAIFNVTQKKLTVRNITKFSRAAASRLSGVKGNQTARRQQERGRQLRRLG